MNLLRIFWVLLISFSISNAFALSSPAGINGISETKQATKKIEGTVTDTSGETLTGVTVAVKGTTNGTITDIDGKYSLSVGADETPTLVFSFIGLKPQTIVGDKSVIDVVMEDDSKVMQEVVIVGYGVQKKVNLTGAVASVDLEKTMGSRPVGDAGRGLQGAIAGLQVTLPTGEVGADPKIRIRGSLASPNSTTSEPLILVDNVEVPSIQMVNPDDIESMSVLKDAASTSIYGAKGAFGVILITTKKGATTDSFTISYSANMSFQNPTRKVEMGGLDGLQYTLDADVNRKQNRPAGTFWLFTQKTLDEKIKPWQSLYGGTVKADDPMLYGRDWEYIDGRKYSYRTYDAMELLISQWAPSQTHNLSLSGRNGKTSYNIGMGYLHQSGMMKPAKQDDYTRYNVSLSLNSQINKYLSIRGGAIYSDRNKRYPSSANLSSDPWLYASRWSSIFPMGVDGADGLPLRNPVFEAANTTTNNTQNVYTSLNLGATVNLTSNWDVQFDYTYADMRDVVNSSKPGFKAGDIFNGVPEKWLDGNGNQIFVNDQGQIVTDGGMEAFYYRQTEYEVFDNSFISRNIRLAKRGTINAYTTYNLKLGEKSQHVFKFMTGINQVTNAHDRVISQKNGLTDYLNPQYNFAVGNATARGDANWGGIFGVFGRVNYTLKEKYLFEANIRRDGSSNFPKHLQWRWFPSFSAGWIASNESFMKSMDPVLSFTKLRASWGKIGDQSVRNSLYVPTLESVKSNWLGANGDIYSYNTPPAVMRDITWQDIENMNIGVDFRFLKDKFGVTFDAYQRYTRNMIIPGNSLPGTFGTAVPQGNYGDLRVRGWELSLDYNHRFANGLNLNASANLYDWTTFVTKGADYQIPKENREIANTYFTGRRLGDIYGYVTDRLYQKDDFVWDGDKMKQVTILVDGMPSRNSNMLAGGNPVYQTALEDGGGIAIFSPGDVKFVDIDGDGYITPGDGTLGNMGDRMVIGNSEPRYMYGLRLGADFKGFDAAVFFQGVGKRQIWGEGQMAIPGFDARDGGIPKAIATDYWREDRPDAYYPRAWDNGKTNSNYSYRMQSKYLLNMAYLRVKNITAGYSLNPKVLKKVHLTKARFYVSLENFFTFDKLRGLPIDPEVVTGVGFNSESYNQTRTGVGAPSYKSASFGVQLNF